ncbi:MAG: TetR/AcrR family transcriptional regulator [Actinomycetota bacterium]|nr:TetR/AcrR family transcriptional regulator [Actinomycetota bacterium]
MVGRPSRAPEVRRTILDGAAEIFSRQGYRATSMNEIAGAVGLSKPTLYHYFRNKEEILVRLYEEVMADAIANATEVAESLDEPLEVLRRLLVYRVRATCERQSMYKVFFEEEAEVPAELIETVLEQRRQYEGILRDQVVRHLGDLKHPPPIEPTIFVNACLGAANWVYKWYSPGGGLSPEQLGQEIASYVLRPLAAQRPLVEERAGL